jgi:hypothetical protein
MVEPRCLGSAQSKRGKMLLPFAISTRRTKFGERAVKLDFWNRSSQCQSIDLLEFYRFLQDG